MRDRMHVVYDIHYYIGEMPFMKYVPCIIDVIAVLAKRMNSQVSLHSAKRRYIQLYQRHAMYEIYYYIGNMPCMIHISFIRHALLICIVYS